MYFDKDVNINYEKLYNELLYAVGKVCPNESRHQTALRYIREAEEGTNESADTAKENI